MAKKKFSIPNGTGGEIYTAVDSSGNIIIWDNRGNESYYFSFEEWEQVNLFVLNEFKKLNAKI